MARGYYKQVIKLLRAAGYEYLTNAKGSHEKWVNPETGEMMLVPRGLDSRHTANDICKDAGLGKKF